MRRMLTLIAMLISMSALFAADIRMQPLIGYIHGEVTLTVSMSQNAFDMEEPNYQENSVSGTSARGFKVGSYSVSSNNAAYRLYIAHDKLLLSQTLGQDDRPLSAIDYNLYVMTGGSAFQSCLSDVNADAEASEVMATAFTNRVFISDAVSLDNLGLYACLNDQTAGTTADTVDILKSGFYTSNVYFYLEVGH